MRQQLVGGSNLHLLTPNPGLPSLHQHRQRVQTRAGRWPLLGRVITQGWGDQNKPGRGNAPGFQVWIFSLLSCLALGARFSSEDPENAFSYGNFSARLYLNVAVPPSPVSTSGNPYLVGPLNPSSVAPNRACSFLCLSGLFSR